MKRLALPGLACALAVAVVGCGPMAAPLPQRFDPETQRQIDAGWDRAFTPANALSRHELLDVMVGTQAYQHGVDTLHLRAAKAFAGGSVVMEIGFDRAKPENDRFEVTVYDPAGKAVRAERFTRKDVEDTIDALYRHAGPPAEREARWKKITDLFPNAGEKEPAPMPRAKG